jgi:hypothetical protein
VSAIAYHPGDARAAWLRGLVAQALAREVTRGANALVATAYAAAIDRNARLRARFRRAQRTWVEHPAWLRRAHHDPITLECWGEQLATGRGEPSCYIYGGKLPVGKLDFTAPHDMNWVLMYLHDHRGDLPCCVCPSEVIMRCLTHWYLYHAGAAGCFRCRGHAAACGPGRWAVGPPLWEGRRTPGFAWPTLPPATMLVLNFDGEPPR